MECTRSALRVNRELHEPAFGVAFTAFRRCVSKDLTPTFDTNQLWLLCVLQCFCHHRRHLLNGFVFSVLEKVRIRVRGGGKIPMSEPLLNHLQIHARRQHQGCLRMPQIMENEGVRVCRQNHGSDTKRSDQSLSREDTHHGYSRTLSAPVLDQTLRPVLSADGFSVLQQPQDRVI